MEIVVQIDASFQPLMDRNIQLFHVEYNENVIQ